MKIPVHFLSVRAPKDGELLPTTDPPDTPADGPAGRDGGLPTTIT